jgi:hypothetical protein
MRDNEKPNWQVQGQKQTYNDSHIMSSVCEHVKMEQRVSWIPPIVTSAGLAKG